MRGWSCPVPTGSAEEGHPRPVSCGCPFRRGRLVRGKAGRSDGKADAWRVRALHEQDHD